MKLGRLICLKRRVTRNKNGFTIVYIFIWIFRDPLSHLQQKSTKDTIKKYVTSEGSSLKLSKKKTQKNSFTILKLSLRILHIFLLYLSQFLFC